jgi:hypothetical protein
MDVFTCRIQTAYCGRDEACDYVIFGELQTCLCNVCSEYQIALSMLTASCFSCLHFSIEVSLLIIVKTKYNLNM